MSTKMFTLEEFIHEHKEVNEFINYCECIITNDGMITYASPSHAHRLMMMYGIPKEELYDDSNEIRRKILDRIPESSAIVDYMAEELRVVVCWYNRAIFPREYSVKQIEVVSALINEGILSDNLNISVSVEKTHHDIIRSDTKWDVYKALQKLHEDAIESRNVIAEDLARRLTVSIHADMVLNNII